LLKNLKSGKYEGIFNYPMRNFEKVLNKEEIEVENEKDEEVFKKINNFIYN
jgi:Mak16 protein C-terminal region